MRGEIRLEEGCKERDSRGIHKEWTLLFLLKKDDEYDQWQIIILAIAVNEGI